MEWLAGAIAGGAIGLASALVANEYKVWRGRRRRKTDLAQLLVDEILFNRNLVELVRGGIAAATEQGKARPQLFNRFPRNAFAACLGHLALLPDDTRRVAQQF